MNIIIPYHGIISTDAVGNDIIQSYHFLKKRGFTVYLYAERCDDELKEVVVDQERLFELIQTKDNLMIFHHAYIWDFGETIIDRARCMIVMKYHNITPPEFFTPYSVELYNNTKKGREQTRRLIGKGKFDWYAADSKYNQLDLIDNYGIDPTKSSIVPPLHRVNDFSLVELKRVIQKEKDTVYVLFVGRFAPNKGHVHLVKTIYEYTRLYDARIVLNIVGSVSDSLRSYYDEIADMIAQYGLTDIIKIHNYVSFEDLYSYYKSSDLFLLMSEHEGFCVPIIESQYNGLPVIAWNTSVISDTLGQGQVAIDELDYGLFAGAIRRVATDTNLRGALIGNGINNYRNYENDRIGPQLVEMIEDIRSGTPRHCAETCIATSIPEKKPGEMDVSGGAKRLPEAHRNPGPLRIIIVSNYYPPNFIGGAEVIAHHQAKAMKSLGHDVIVFAGDTRGLGPRYSIHEDDYEGLTVYRVALENEDYSTDYFNFSHREIEVHFKKLAESFNPDVVHIHNVMGLSLGIIHIARKKGIKTFITLHDNWGFCCKNTILKNNSEICATFEGCESCLRYVNDGCERRIPIAMRKDFFMFQLHEVDGFISPSRYIADNYIRAGFPGEKFSVIWNGIDIEKFSSITKKESREIRFTYIGYLGHHKGVHVLIDTLHFLKKEPIRINLVGEGDQGKKLEKKARRYGKSKQVAFWGKVDNRRIGEVLGDTDVFVLPSIWPENQPVTITEAMASGIPVIASNIGGIPELIDDGVSGFLFKPGDVRDLYNKMMFFIMAPEKIREFGLAAFNTIAARTFQSQVREIVDLYTDELSAGDTAEERLVVCVGKRMMDECNEAINLVKYDSDPCFTGTRFVLDEWIDRDQIQKAKILWVVDEHIKEDMIKPFLDINIPLVVPEQNNGLKQYCVENNCGLYFKDAFEACECLIYLLNNESILIGIGRKCSSSMT
ncbi:MAG: glycosyltransferase [Spirochaetes bacterium]|nr:glycosyltransferase [Spirochaetota bacterium]